MGYSQEDMEMSLERWHNANEVLASAVGQDGFLERLNQNPPESVEELNLQAYSRENVADNTDRYISAAENYFEILDRPFTQEMRAEFIRNIPTDIQDFCIVSDYMEEMTKQLRDLKIHAEGLAMQGNPEEAWQKWNELTQSAPENFDLVFDSAQSHTEIRATQGVFLVVDPQDLYNADYRQHLKENELTGFPEIPEKYKLAAHIIRHEIDPAVLGHLSESTFDFKTLEQGKMVSEDHDSGDYRIVSGEEYAVTPIQLANHFEVAQTHVGSDSLETMSEQARKAAFNKPANDAAYNQNTYGS